MRARSGSRAAAPAPTTSFPNHSTRRSCSRGFETAERILSLETRDVAIFAMAKLAESRDPETGAHLERVRAYSRVLATHLGGLDKFRGEINAEYIRLIYLTSPLHDIGKVGIPDCVLLKPGRLSDREFEIMKTHAILARRRLMRHCDSSLA